MSENKNLKDLLNPEPVIVVYGAKEKYSLIGSGKINISAGLSSVKRALFHLFYGLLDHEILTKEAILKALELAEEAKEIGCLKDVVWVNDDQYKSSAEVKDFLNKFFKKSNEDLKEGGSENV